MDAPQDDESLKRRLIEIAPSPPNRLREAAGEAAQVKRPIPPPAPARAARQADR
jgi:hypothetical protein